MNYLIFNKSTALLLATIILVFTSCDNSDKKTASTPSKTANASVSSTPTGSQSKAKQELKDAPDFTLETMSGEPFTLSEHEGKVVVLNIWATWCPPCRKEIPDFIELQKEMKDDGVLFAGVSIDERGWAVVRPFAQKFGINYPIMVDDGTVYQKYGPFRGIPTTFFINKKGKIEYIAPGMVNKKMIQPLLEKLTGR